MGAWLIAAAGFVGLLIGSFLNVVVHRVPAGRSVVRPPSACPHCGHAIRRRDNLPVLSWILLVGRCRDCRVPIPIRYPLVEAATGALFAGAAAVLGPVAVLPAYLWFAAATFALALVDLDHRRLPNRILYPGTAAGAILLAVGSIADGDAPALGRAALGASAYFGFLLLIALAARGGFGFGDVKLGFLLGLFLAHRSWGSLAVGAFGGFLIGGVVSLGLLAAGRAGRRDAIPFGPWMVLGAYVGIVAGEQIWSWYLG